MDMDTIRELEGLKKQLEAESRKRAQAEQALAELLRDKTAPHFTYRMLRSFFPPQSQAHIRLDFNSSCVICIKTLKPGEGCCVPILCDITMVRYSSPVLGSYTGSSEYSGPGVKSICWLIRARQ